jgi:catechol 2,3-dioxygenase-like lactoylglutathione lyase family enzyme
VEDVDEEYERLKSLNVEFVKLPQNHPWGCRSLWFRDPDGNIIDFFTIINQNE